MITLAINPNFGKDLFTDVLPILFYVVLVVMIISLISIAYKREYKEMGKSLLMYGIILTICKKPELLLLLGNFIVLNTGEILKNLIA